jgi:aspartate kinase
MLLVIKFGGTSVQDADRIRNAAGLVKHVLGQGHRVVVVTSAMAGVTNDLVKVLGEPAAAAGGADSRMADYFRFTKVLEQKHLEVARGAIRDARLIEEVAGALYMERHGLDRILIGSHLLGELTPIGFDYVVSEGERLCLPILAGCLRDQGIDAVGLGGDEAGIVTDNNYGNSLPDEGRTRAAAREALLPLLEAARVPVVAGFYGRSGQGRVAILGRGGSDYTATLLGCSLDADEIWLLKHEVDGIKTTDPRLVPGAYTISEMSYEIAAEMALLGAKVLHPKSVQPAARHHIPVRIGTSTDLARPGTRLVPARPGAAPGVAALTLVRGGGLIRVNSPQMGDEGIIPESLIDQFRRYNVDILASAAGLNGGRVLWLVGSLDLQRFLSVVREHIDGRLGLDVRENVAVLGIVGEQVATAAGVFVRVACCLEKAGTQPLAILQGASPDSIAVALPDEEERLPAALRLLHTELGLDRRAG